MVMDDDIAMQLSREEGVQVATDMGHGTLVTCQGAAGLVRVETVHTAVQTHGHHLHLPPHLDARHRHQLLTVVALGLQVIGRQGAHTADLGLLHLP